MLDGLDPRTEIAYRHALMGISGHCRGDRIFELKTMALRAQLRLDEDEVGCGESRSPRFGATLPAELAASH